MKSLLEQFTKGFDMRKKKTLKQEIAELLDEAPIKYYHVAFYDKYGDCYDEILYKPKDKENALSYLQYISDQLKVFIDYTDGISLELDKNYKDT